MIFVVPGWPTIPFGGCRYLQEARIKLIEQYAVLETVQGEKYPAMFGESLSEVYKDYVKFGRKEFHSSEEQQPREEQTPWPGLWTSLARNTLRSDLRTAMPSDLKRWVAATNRSCCQGRRARPVSGS